MRQPLSAIQWALCGFQSTHPLRDATNPLGVESFFVSISIHAPLTGCDADDATHRLVTDISIHAPLTGCDQQQILFIYAKADFNPRTPYGMRLYDCTDDVGATQFQSTHPLRDATLHLLKQALEQLFQSTHPLRDATRRFIIWDMFLKNFNPRTPYGMRHGATGAFPHTGTFQSTHPLRDATAISLPF